MEIERFKKAIELDTEISKYKKLLNRVKSNHDLSCRYDYYIIKDDIEKIINEYITKLETDFKTL